MLTPVYITDSGEFRVPWKDSTVEVEDEKIKYYLPLMAKYVTHHEPQDEKYQLTPENRDEAMEFGDEVILKPGIYMVDLPEFEVVEQLRTNFAILGDPNGFCTEWSDRDKRESERVNVGGIEYRQVARFKLTK